MIRCPVCGKEFTDKKELLEHIKSEHYREYYEAYRMAAAQDKGEEYQPELGNEKEKPGNEKEEPTKPKSEPQKSPEGNPLPPVKWICPACGKELPSRGALVGHLLSVHKEYK